MAGFKASDVEETAEDFIRGFDFVFLIIDGSDGEMFFADVFLDEGVFEG